MELKEIKERIKEGIDQQQIDTIVSTLVDTEIMEDVSSIRDIFAIDSKNIGEANESDFEHFFYKFILNDYYKNNGKYYKEEEITEEVIEEFKENFLRLTCGSDGFALNSANLYSSFSSVPQTAELVLNVDSDSVFKVLEEVYAAFKRQGIQCTFKFPYLDDFVNGYTNNITLTVPPMELEKAINAIQSLDSSILDLVSVPSPLYVGISDKIGFDYANVAIDRKKSDELADALANIIHGIVDEIIEDNPNELVEFSGDTFSEFRSFEENVLYADLKILARSMQISPNIKEIVKEEIKSKLDNEYKSANEYYDSELFGEYSQEDIDILNQEAAPLDESQVEAVEALVNETINETPEEESLFEGLGDITVDSPSIEGMPIEGSEIDAFGEVAEEPAEEVNVAEDFPVGEIFAEEQPAEEAPVEEIPVEETLVEEVPAEEVSEESAPMTEAFIDDILGDVAPLESEEISTDEVPAEVPGEIEVSAPGIEYAEEQPAEVVEEVNVAEELPVDEAPVEEIPVEEVIDTPEELEVGVQEEKTVELPEELPEINLDGQPEVSEEVPEMNMDTVTETPVLPEELPSAEVEAPVLPEAPMESLENTAILTEEVAKIANEEVVVDSQPAEVVDVQPTEVAPNEQVVSVDDLSQEQITDIKEQLEGVDQVANELNDLLGSMPEDPEVLSQDETSNLVNSQLDVGISNDKILEYSSLIPDSSILAELVPGTDFTYLAYFEENKLLTRIKPNGNYKLYDGNTIRGDVFVQENLIPYIKNHGNVALGTILEEFGVEFLMEEEAKKEGLGSKLKGLFKSKK